MKFKSIPLHIKIVLALILGAFFGSLFSIDLRKLVVITIEKSIEKKKILENYDFVEFIYLEDGDYTKEITKKFKGDEQNLIIQYFKSLKQIEKNTLKVKFEFLSKEKDKNNTSYRTIELVDVEEIKKPNTPATMIKPLGTLFIRLLSFLAIPLVIASLILGAASLEDVKKLGRIGLKTLTLYVITTAIAITIGLTVANVIEPGKKIASESKERLMGEFQLESTEKITANLDIDIIDFFVEIVPRNPFDAIANGNMLQIVFFAVMLGITLTFIDRKKSKPVIKFFDGISATMIKMVDIIMKIAPFGVFALISATIAEFGFGIISTLIWYIIAVLAGLFLHTILVYGSVVGIIGKMNPLKFFKGVRNAQAIGFSTSSSAATLPITFDCVENNLKVPKQISGFVLPLGATINMDGTALYQGVAAVFIAQVYGIDLHITQQLTIVLTAVLASIGTAPVPGVGIIMLVMILNAVHIPPEGIALIIGVDRILDMCRTITNVTGDASVAVAINGTEQKKRLQ